MSVVVRTFYRQPLQCSPTQVLTVKKRTRPPLHPSTPCSLGRGHGSSSPGWEGTAVCLHPLPEVVPLAVWPRDTASCSGRALLCVVAWAASPDGPSSQLHSRQAATAHVELPQPQPSPVPSLPWDQAPAGPGGWVPLAQNGPCFDHRSGQTLKLLFQPSPCENPSTNGPQLPGLPHCATAGGRNYVQLPILVVGVGSGGCCLKLTPPVHPSLQN